jgi:hypothetical protein
MENNGMQIETKMMLPVKKNLGHIRVRMSFKRHYVYNSANFMGPSKGTLHTQLVIIIFFYGLMKLTKKKHHYHIEQNFSLGYMF